MAHRRPPPSLPANSAFGVVTRFVGQGAEMGEAGVGGDCGKQVLVALSREQ
jgi:hypothetical protein